MECVACGRELPLDATDAQAECFGCGASYFPSDTWILPAFAVAMTPRLETEVEAPVESTWVLDESGASLERVPRFSWMPGETTSRAKLDSARLVLDHRTNGLFGLGSRQCRVEVPTTALRGFFASRRHLMLQNEDVVTHRFGASGGVFALATDPVPESGEPVVPLLPQWLQGRFFFVDEVGSYEAASVIATTLNRTLERFRRSYR